MTRVPNLSFKAEGYCVLLRLLLGFSSAMVAQFSHSDFLAIFWSGVMLVLCVWLDAITGWYFRRFGPKSPQTAALEIYADVICFVLAPIEFTLAFSTSVWLLSLLPVFLLAAVYRLARFQVQGLVNNGYLGLPVTYNGYLFPLAGLAIHFVPLGTDIILIVLLIASSFLMVSSRFVVPEL